MTDMFQEFLADDRYADAAGNIIDNCGLERTHPFYKLFMGASLYQVMELLSYMGVGDEEAQKWIDGLLVS